MSANNTPDSGGTNQNIIFLLLLVLIGGVVVLYFTMRAPKGDGTLTEESAETGMYREVVDVLNRIAAVKTDKDGRVLLNSQMFQDAQFRALRDGSVKIDPPPESSYRKSNPFLPF